MALLVDPSGKKFDVPDENVERASKLYGLVPAEKFAADQAEEAKPLTEKIGDTLQSFGEGATRQLQRVQDFGVEQLGLPDTRPQSDPYDPHPEQIYSPSSGAAKQRAENHPIAAAAGQMASMAPTLALGGGAQVLALDSALGGVSGEAENAWKENRQFSTEAAVTNTAAGLLLGGGLMAASAGAGALVRVGRNLLTEGEHAASARAARDLMDQASESAAKEGKLSATEIATKHPDDAGVAYLRDNADTLTDQIATKQAKAAQELLDSYGEVSKLKPKPKDLEFFIPEENKLDQARWVSKARSDVLEVLNGDGVPDSVSGPLRKAAADLDTGKPSEWFSKASDLSDELVQARARLAKANDIPAEVTDLAESQAPAAEGAAAAPDPVAALGQARDILHQGLSDPKIWGEAATQEAARGAGYARRVNEHVADFESLFTSRVGGKQLADPAKFRAHLDSDAVNGALRQRTLDATLEAARATADQAAKFGQHEDAQRILGAVTQLEQLQGQAQAVSAAVRAAPAAADTSGAAKSGLEYLASLAKKRAGSVAGGFVGHAIGGPIGSMVGMAAGQAAQSAVAGLAARASAFKAVQRFSAAAASSTRIGTQELLSGALAGGARAGSAVASGLRIAAPVASGVTALNFDATRDHIEKMATDPKYFGEVMGNSFGSLAEHAPELHSAIAAQTAKAVNYLNAVAPGGRSGGPFGMRFPVAEDELWDFQQRVAAISDPDFVRNQLARGMLSSQAAEAFQAVNPAQFQRLQIEVFDRLRTMQQEGLHVPTQAREQIDTLLGIDGGGDPGLTWQVAERAQAAQAAHAQQLAKTPPPGVKLPSAQSSALATLGNGATAQG